jgi:glycosyltransferase involved in cell wall biosynthesis
VIDRQKLEWEYHEAMADRGALEWHRLEARRFRRWEQSLAGRFARVLAITDRERDALTELHGGRARVVPLAVDDAIRMRAARTTRVDHVLLYGPLDYPPNADACTSYFRDVWPRLRAAAPGLRTLIVGSGALPPEVPAADPRVERLGYVERIAGVLDGPGALVLPLRVGGGARTKALEALAAGMPVVSTRVGVEGLGLLAGRHFVAAETPAEISDALIALAADPSLGAALGRAGAAFVDERHRWDRIAPLLEDAFRAALHDDGRGAAPRARRRVLLVGVHPWPDDEDASGLSFPGHRTAQFASALAGGGCDVESVLLDEEGGEAAAPHGARLLSPERFRAGQELQRIHDALAPDVVVAAGGYHAARVVSRLVSERPRWIDLPGDLAAEGQLHAERGNGAVADYLGVLADAVAAGDRFSVVGRSQRLALLGQLGLAGRLTADTIGIEPVEIVPLACGGPEAPPALPAGGFQVLWAGSYNAWMDPASLLAGLENAMAADDALGFVSIGGPLAGHAPAAHAAFWSAARASRFAARFRDLGRVTRRRAREALAASHAVLCVSRPCLEAELGSRQRLVEAMAHGRPVVTTSQGDLAAEIAGAGAGVVAGAGRPEELAAALLALAGDRARLEAMAARARELWRQRYTYAAATGRLAAWAAAPSRWPASVLSGDGLARLRDERRRLQADLDAIRGSYTFRALRAVDRLLGRNR